jgi:hypothetical protein
MMDNSVFMRSTDSYLRLMLYRTITGRRKFLSLIKQEGN